MIAGLSFDAWYCQSCQLLVPDGHTLIGHGWHGPDHQAARVVPVTVVPRRLARCTGVAAVWCTIHGDCTCPTADDGSRDFTRPGNCPLHSPTSEHAKAHR